MAGGKNKIHEHPNAGTNSFKHRPEDCGRKPTLINMVNKELKKQGFKEVTKGQQLAAIRMLSNLPVSKLKEISEPKNNYPFFWHFIAKEVLSKKGQEMMKDLLNRTAVHDKDSIDHPNHISIVINEKELKSDNI